MTKNELQWLLVAASNAPIQTTADARHKANCILALVEQLEPEPPETEINSVGKAGV